METSNTYLSAGSRMKYKHSLLFPLKKEHISDLWISKLEFVHSGPRTYTSAQLPLKSLRPLPSILNFYHWLLGSEGFEFDFSHLYALQLVFHLENSLMGCLRSHNREPTSLKNDWISTIYPSQAIINLVFLTFIYTSTYVFIIHLLIYLRLRLPAKKMMYIITK